MLISPRLNADKASLNHKASVLFSLHSDYKNEIDRMERNYKVATLGAGCFWCVEAVFQQLRGVESVVSGYMGGRTENPTYREICSGTTGHAEVAQITFDAEIISFADILKVFWGTHDPTTLNQQGHDRGTQYRSVVFYHSEEQKSVAEVSKGRQLHGFGKIRL